MDVSSFFMIHDSCNHNLNLMNSPPPPPPPPPPSVLCSNNSSYSHDQNPLHLISDAYSNRSMDIIANSPQMYCNYMGLQCMNHANEVKLGNSYLDQAGSMFNGRATVGVGAAPYANIAGHDVATDHYHNNANNNSSSNDGDGDGDGVDGDDVNEVALSPSPVSGKYVRYTMEQIRILERSYEECPKPSAVRRDHLVRQNPALHNIEPRQIKVWFQNRRCREKQRKETLRLQMVNMKLASMNKLLMDENVRLQSQLSHLLHENGYLLNLKQQQQQLFLHHSATINITPDTTSCDSIVTSRTRHFPNPPQQQQSSNTTRCDVSNYPGILALAEQALVEFIEKATAPVALDSPWIQMHGLPKPGSQDTSVVMNLCCGVATRASGIVNLEPAKIVEALKERPTWQRECHAMVIISTSTATKMNSVSPTNIVDHGHTDHDSSLIEVLHVQMYAPTTLSLPRDFCILRYTHPLEDGGFVVCHKSLNAACMSHNMAPYATTSSYERAEMYASGYLIRPCEGNSVGSEVASSVVTIVDHIDLDPLMFPGVAKAYYQSPSYSANTATISALKYLRCVAQEMALHHETPGNIQQQSAAIRSLSHRLAKGFNCAVSGLADDGWIPVKPSNGLDIPDVSIMIRNVGAQSNARSDNDLSLHSSTSDNIGVVCAKASVMIKNVKPSLLIGFLREHRSDQWVNNSGSSETDTVGMRALEFDATPRSSQLQVHSIDDDEFLELIKMEDQSDLPPHGHNAMDGRDMFLIQLCNGLDNRATNANCGAEMVFASIEVFNMSNDITLIPSGFRVIPLENISGLENGKAQTSRRTLDLASTLDVGLNVANYIIGSETSTDIHKADCRDGDQLLSVLTIAFQFSFKTQTRETVTNFAEQCVRNVLTTVERVCRAMEASTLPLMQQPVESNPKQNTISLPQSICKSYK